MGREYRHYGFARKLGLWAGTGLIDIAYVIELNRLARHHSVHFFVTFYMPIWLASINLYLLASFLWWHWKELPETNVWPDEDGH